MPQTYLQDLKKIIDALSADDAFTLEGRLILLGMMADYMADVTKKLEDELAEDTGDQIIN